MPLEDEELVLGCLEGKKEAWGEFVDRFAKLIHWSIRQTVQKVPLGGVDELCEEVFQELFKKLLEKDELSKLRDAKNIRKFLSVTACHAAMDKLKSLGRYERKKTVSVFETGEDGTGLSTDLCDAAEINPATEALSRERNDLIAQALESLSCKERACVEFHFLDGKTHFEIGRILGISQDTVSTVIRRTKEKLKKNFIEKGLNE